MKICVVLLLGFAAAVHGGPKGGTNDNCTEHQTRLLTGTTDISAIVPGGDVRGLVQVCEGSLWKFICDGDWTAADATVACRQLGYGAAASRGTASSQSQPNALSYTPQCSGTEQNISSCMSTPHSEDCDIQVAVSCSINATTIITSLTLSSSPTTSSSSAPSIPSNTPPTVQRTPPPSRTTIKPAASHPPAETASTDTPVVSTTPSLDVQTNDDESTNERTALSSNAMYIIIGSGAVVVLALVVLAVAAVIVCRKCCVRRGKGPVVEDHTYDEKPVPGQQNQTYLEMEHSKNGKQLPETEILYDQVKDPAQPDGTGQTYHTLNHSPEISSKRSNGSCSEVPPNEALYEKILNPPSQQPQVAQKPVYHTLEDPKRGKPLYHTLESDTAVGSPHKYHVLESSSHKYHVLESPQGKEEPVYSEAGQRRAATFPRMGQVHRGGLNGHIFGGQVEEML